MSPWTSGFSLFERSFISFLTIFSLRDTRADRGGVRADSRHEASLHSGRVHVPVVKHSCSHRSLLGSLTSKMIGEHVPWVMVLRVTSKLAPISRPLGFGVSCVLGVWVGWKRASQAPIAF